MNYSFHPLAEVELNEGIEHYNNCKLNLGFEFAKEVYNTIQNILNFPNAWTSLSENTKRCLTNRFPYGIIYTLESDEIIIIAVMQLTREPNYWESRTK